jgi:GTP pyrophosphokinase
VGNHCAGAKVNGRIVTLDYPLQNGDIVEVITQKSAHPSLDWMSFVATTGARNRIRQWYKRSHRDENVARGRDLLEKELGKEGFESLLKSDPAQVAAERCNYQTVDDLLAGLGYGEVTLNLVVNRLRDAVKAQQPIAPEPTTEELLKEAVSHPAPRPQPSSKSPILGVEGLLHHIAGCCNPLPGEPIIGVVTMSSRGISIHRQDCANIQAMKGDRFIPVSWNQANDQQGRPQTYPVNVQIEVIDRVGVLKDILSHLTDHKINVNNAQVKTSPGETALINLGIDIRDHQQLEQTFNQIRKMADVLNLRRVTQAD